MPRRSQPLFPRSLAARQTQPPSATDDAVVIRPLVDGAGFVVAPADLQAMGLEEAAVTELCRALRQVNLDAGKAYAAARRVELRRAASKHRHDLLCLAAVLAATAALAVGYGLSSQWGTCALAAAFALGLAGATGYALCAVAGQVAAPADYSVLLRAAVQAATPRLTKLLAPRGWRLEAPADCFWLRLLRAAPPPARGSLNLYN